MGNAFKFQISLNSPEPRRNTAETEDAEEDMAAQDWDGMEIVEESKERDAISCGRTERDIWKCFLVESLGSSWYGRKLTAGKGAQGGCMQYLRANDSSILHRNHTQGGPTSAHAMHDVLQGILGTVLTPKFDIYR